APSPVSEPELVALTEDRPLLGALLGALENSTDDALFEFGLAALLAGIEQIVAGAAPRPDED
ncbi:MAG: hypothetical protein AB7O53_08765, partial [Thermoleophilia bacterium]